MVSVEFLYKTIYFMALHLFLRVFIIIWSYHVTAWQNHRKSTLVHGRSLDSNLELQAINTVFMLQSYIQHTRIYCIYLVSLWRHQLISMASTAYVPYVVISRKNSHVATAVYWHIPVLILQMRTSTQHSDTMLPFVWNQSAWRALCSREKERPPGTVLETVQSSHQNM